ncbi:hypothetical protein BELL_0114g00120 [Botrytis elliptica]|uniref:Uncharacterized protein n=1 Tax=Botrytis elliptica TaxID=278938 RepID=A0A4Z1JV08_9HELO|nr:hypothetical protein BELL_0114g00120 [Botrytis elliptica]
MDLDIATRNKAILTVLQYLASFFHRTKYNFSGLFSDLLGLGYDGQVLQWPLRFIPGKLYNNEYANILQGAIRRLFLIREPLTMKAIVDKSTTTDLHLYVDSTPSKRREKETPTSLAMYDLEGFLVWRRLLKELGFDISAFVARELEIGGLKSIGWSQETLVELFHQDFTSFELPKSSHSVGCRPCDRCGMYGDWTELRRVDLEWRRKLRIIRTGKMNVETVDHGLLPTRGIGANIIDRTNKDTPETDYNSLPWRLVCPVNCEDGMCVAWQCENSEPPNFPPYIPKEERERLKKLRLAEEEATCPTYTMPGAFSV